MPNIQVRLRRGSATDHDTTSGGFTGAEGEVTVDTTNDTLRVHDGSTAGGVRLAKYSELGAGGATDLAASATGTSLTITSSTGNDASVPAATTSAWGAMTDEDKTKLDGLVSNATHTGDVTGSTALTIANDAVTFAKMQNINTAKVIGRTTAGTGNPEEVSILDEDAMTSNSATALATQQSIKAYVDARTVSKYSTGWVNTDGSTSVANGATLSFTHNLGTTDLNVDVYVADNSSGTNALNVQLITIDLSGNSNGSQIQDVTSTTLSVQLASSGYLDINSSGTITSASFASKYIKVVAIG